ncbi:MAG: TolC family protein [Candidatus Eisenbacteria bacterium]
MGGMSILRRASRAVMCSVLFFISAAEASTLSLEWGDVPAWAERHAPELAAFEAGLRAARAERDVHFQWAHPELAYDREEVGEETEQRLTLEKTMENPWLRGVRGEYWNARLGAAEADRAYRAGEVVYELRRDYLRLRLAEGLLEELLAAYAALTRLSSSAVAGEEEGSLSAMEAGLVRSTLTGIHFRIVSLDRDREVREAEWRARMGIEPTTDLLLVTRIGMPTVRLPEEDALLADATGSAGVRALEGEVTARRRQASVERRRSLPALRLSGGYKYVDPGEGGYAAGAAITFPLFHANGAAVAKARAEREESEARLFALRGEIEGEVRALRESVHRMAPVLVESGASPSPGELIERLLTAYEEGWIPMGELLTGLGIAFDGAFDRARLLEEYYDAILRLEWVTGRAILAPGEGGSEQ